MSVNDLGHGLGDPTSPDHGVVGRFRETLQEHQCSFFSLLENELLLGRSVDQDLGLSASKLSGKTGFPVTVSNKVQHAKCRVLSWIAVFFATTLALVRLPSWIILVFLSWLG
jgi:hypothetical protein